MLQTLSFINLKQSKGNFFADTDGNVILDLNCPLPLGYNNDALINARDSTTYDRFLQGTCDVSAVPPQDFADMLADDIMPVAPTGLDQVQLCDGSSTTANEMALSAAIMQFGMANRCENYSDLSVMGVTGSAHGCSIATMSCSDSLANVGNIPTYDWPSVDLPSMKLPYAPNELENKAAEEQALEQASKMVQERRAAGKDVAAMIVEPMASLSMRFATPNFYKGLRRLAKAEGIPFIVDETKSGMG